MKYRVLALEYDYGTDGLEIARAVAERQGMRCYDDQLTVELANKLSISVKEYDRFVYLIDHSVLYSFHFAGSVQPKLFQTTERGDIYENERNLVRKAASGGKAVIVGHCSANLLCFYPDVLTVYITGSIGKCVENVMARENLSRSDALLKVQGEKERYDNHHKAATGSHYYDNSNYNLILNRDQIEMENAISLLCGAFA